MPVEILDGEDEPPTAQAAQTPEAPRHRVNEDPASRRQAALDEEIRNIPPSRHFSSRDKAKIISSVIKAVPKEYVEKFPPAADAQFGAMQAVLLDVLIKAEGFKRWLADVTSQLQRQVHRATNAGDYAMTTVEKVRLEMQETIEAQRKELAVLRSDKKQCLNKINEQVLAIETLNAEALSAQSFLQEAEAKVKEAVGLRQQVGSLEEMVSASQAEISQIRAEAKLAADETRERTRRAWDACMEDFSFSWFERQIEKQGAIIAAERQGLPTPVFEDSDAESKEVNSPAQEEETSAQPAPKPAADGPDGVDASTSANSAAAQPARP
ncbi:uncharacterized protein [Spinacia oleracea]|uniref:Uncharacterized protein n=1 Tax=Spinacia oleracea TaxID=3562 RepID=A0ABM3RRD8_SPIOL|nr:uncharacterized protein LOC130471870 [Spinacia oleracea]